MMVTLVESHAAKAPPKIYPEGGTFFVFKI